MPTDSPLEFISATAWDVSTTAGVLATAASETALGRWLEPGYVRPIRLYTSFRTLVSAALRQGVVRLVEERQTAVAAAVWLPCTPGSLYPVLPSSAPDGQADGYELRSYLLDREMAARHPAAAHEHLVCLGVLPGRQNQGIGTMLLTEPRPAGPGPRFVSATGARSRMLFQRCGYQDDGPPVAFADGAVRVWPMWSPATEFPSRPGPANRAGHRFTATGRFTGGESRAQDADSGSLEQR
jgi:ribosomal protein S18 acetylase RimI-like enzyme